MIRKPEKYTYDLTGEIVSVSLADSDLVYRGSLYVATFPDGSTRPLSGKQLEDDFTPVAEKEQTD